jgi:pyruvate/2-oxoglutarate dehydrogenase complex dihydrolipoamide dehydrogenase (E3) component
LGAAGGGSWRSWAGALGAAEGRAARPSSEPLAAVRGSGYETGHLDVQEPAVTAATPDRTVDLVVLGAGAVGENAAWYASQRGLECVVVEAELVGGECSYWACMPSKALLRPGEVLAAARRVPAAAGAVTGGVDVAAALASRDAFTSNLDDSGQVSWLDSEGIGLVRGWGRLAGERRVEVTHEDGSTTLLEARRGVALAIGSRSAMPPIDGLADVRAWDSRDVTSMRAVPDRLLVLGGGVVGCEMAQAVRFLGGSEVTIVEGTDRLLGREEPYVGDALAEALRADGIEVVLGATVTAVARDGDDGEVTLTLEDGCEVTGDELLVAVGRRVPSDDVGLDTIGVTPGRGGVIEVTDHLAVPGHESWLYVVGDANGRAQLTHQGKYQARLVGDAVAGIEVDAAWADTRALPRVVFTDPQVAAVGLTEQQARDEGHEVLVVGYDVGDTAGGSLQGEDVGGRAQLVIDDERRLLLGATFVGPGVDGLLHAATVAIVGEVPLARLQHAVPSYPTTSEVWLRLLEEVRRVDLGR